jgi:cyclopropane-fatty-acyl-phospholipid synthase
VYRLRHLLNRNSQSNSRKNIHAHYDLGNAFYELWLDDTMNYSSAWFDGDQGQSMQTAQHAKVRRALRMAGVQPGNRVLEIGCGWGALAEMATTEFGASVTGVTLSTEQLALRAGPHGPAWDAEPGRSAAAGLPRHPRRARSTPSAPLKWSRPWAANTGPPTSRRFKRLLKPGGKACIQSIVIDDALWERYIASTDFIQQYIFPGGCLPCPREFRREAAAAGLKVVDEFAFGADYAETLRSAGASSFLAHRHQVLQQGFDERFMHTWEFYLAYCEAAFAGPFFAGMLFCSTSTWCSTRFWGLGATPSLPRCSSASGCRPPPPNPRCASPCWRRSSRDT